MVERKKRKAARQRELRQIRKEAEKIKQSNKEFRDEVKLTDSQDDEGPSASTKPVDFWDQFAAYVIDNGSDFADLRTGTINVASEDDKVPSCFTADDDVVTNADIWHLLQELD